MDTRARPFRTARCSHVRRCAAAVQTVPVDTTHEPFAKQPAGFWRRYGLGVYWLIFAIYTLQAARDPGLVVHRDAARYPWLGVVATWIELALEVALLGWILRPRTYHRSWGRLAAALAVYAVLAVQSVITSMTDLPGYSYVPGQFHMLTFVVLTVFMLTSAARTSGAASD